MAHLVFEHVWKRFRLGQAHDSLRELVPALARRLVGRAPATPGPSRNFWALRDVSFAVEPGEVLGIIGPNGAGKSTTLKLLNRILEPTAGAVRTAGKIGALIEVSAGFHQDLTGRQNVYLQGAIMGMRKQEVARKFDEIVAFAGVEEFLDTPVKRYSSGMNARLGFAIAAHLEPEILIIDEVLAVGDAAFQAKAFGRIRQMATGGAPVVLVSHQLDRIAELCTKAILLEKGTVRATGTPMQCINTYLHGLALGEQTGHAEATISFERILAPNGLAVVSGETLSFVVSGRADTTGAPETWTPAFRIVERKTRTEMHTITGIQRGIPLPVSGEFEYELTFQMNLPPGGYEAYPVVWDAATWSDVITGPRLHVEVLEGPPFYGAVQLNAGWRVLRGAPFETAASRRHNA